MTLAPYADYQPAPAGWIGQIPAHWDVERIKFSLSEKSKVIASGLPAGAISYGRVVKKDGEKILPETLASYQEVRAGEFLINPINLNYDLVSLRTALSDIDVVVSPAYIVLRADEAKLDPRYGNYLLHIFDIRHMKTLGAGIRQTIGFQDIGNCHWVLPPLEEQTIIADYIDRETQRIDRLIERKSRFIGLLKEKRSAVITRAVTKGTRPATSMKETNVEWLEEIPAHWSVVRGSHALIERRERNTGLKSDNYLSLTARRGVITYQEKGNVGNKKPDDLEKCKIVYPGDYVINSMNYQIGSYGVSPHFGICSPVYVVMTHREGVADPDFLDLILANSSYQNYAQSFGTGILDHRRAIGWEEIRVIPIPLPPLVEQREIVQWANEQRSRIDALIEKTSRSVDLLYEHRTALITAAVTGKIDVRNAA